MRTFRDFLVMEETRKEYGELIRDALKKAGYKVPKEVTVKTAKGGYERAYYVTIRTFSINKEDVEKVINKFKEIDIDERTGEILGGGNTFIFVNYDSNLESIEGNRLKRLEKEVMQKYFDNEGSYVKLGKGLEIMIPGNQDSYRKANGQFIYSYKLNGKETNATYWKEPIWRLLAKAGF